VLLHGQPGAGSDWNGVVRALPAGTRCLAPDRPGYRSNPRPPGGLVANARWLIGEMDDAGLDDAILVGHSFGGGVALTVAALAPERVRGLVLIASIGPGCLDGWDTLLAAPVAGTVCALAAWWLTPGLAEKRLARIERIRDSPLESHEYVHWEIWSRARHDHGQMWRTFLVEQRDLVHGLAALTASLDTIRTPALIVADPSDKMIPFATATQLRDRLSGGRLVIVGRGGHSLPRRIPEVIAAQLVVFAAGLG
jgi:pimeloyl-ACP methyl ester carboxylesterase